MSQALSTDPKFAGTKTEIRFVSGFEPAFEEWQREVAENLSHRFAVIQESYRPDSVDMFFDEPLWLALIRFAGQYAAGEELRIICDGTPKTLERFSADWDSLDKDDRSPQKISVRRDDIPVLVIEPEYWTAIGGPMPYHDSYTYSVYANEDLSRRLFAFLSQAEAASGWKMPDAILNPSTRRSVWQNLRRQFRRISSGDFGNSFD